MVVAALVITKALLGRRRAAERVTGALTQPCRAKLLAAYAKPVTMQGAQRQPHLAQLAMPVTTALWVRLRAGYAPGVRIRCLQAQRLAVYAKPGTTQQLRQQLRAAPAAMPAIIKALPGLLRRAPHALEGAIPHRRGLACVSPVRQSQK